MTRNVALLRASEDAELSARRLAQRGFGSVIAPVLCPRALPAKPPSRSFAAVLATSARAFEFATPEILEAARGLPLFVVGERSARAATALGFALAAPAAGEGESLALSLTKSLAPHSRLLYLCGRDRKPDLEGALTAAGHLVEPLEVYEARARPSWSEDELAGLAGCFAALHYSRRSAELSCRLAKTGGIGEIWRATAHVCISRDPANVLADFGAARVIVASRPREAELFEALENVSVD